MSESSDVSSFESSDNNNNEEEMSISDTSSKNEEDGDQEIIDSVKASTSRNKSFQKKNKDESSRLIKKVRYVYPPKPGEKDERISPKIMSPFEYAEIIGELTEKISQSKIKIHPKYFYFPTVDLLKIARMMIDDTSIDIPLMYKRPIDNPTNPTLVEIFKVRELLTPSQRLINHIEKYTPVSNWKVFE